MYNKAILLMSVIVTLQLMNFSASARIVQDLKYQCESSVLEEQLKCLDYIEGATEALKSANDIQKVKKHAAYQEFANDKNCWDVPVSIGQMQDAFLKWARENPAMYQISAGSGVFIAYLATFCPAKK